MYWFGWQQDNYSPVWLRTGMLLCKILLFNSLASVSCGVAITRFFLAELTSDFLIKIDHFLSGFKISWFMIDKKTTLFCHLGVSIPEWLNTGDSWREKTEIYTETCSTNPTKNQEKDFKFSSLKALPVWERSYKMYLKSGMFWCCSSFKYQCLFYSFGDKSPS